MSQGTRRRFLTYFSSVGLSLQKPDGRRIGVFNDISEPPPPTRPRTGIVYGLVVSLFAEPLPQIPAELFRALENRCGHASAGGFEKNGGNVMPQGSGVDRRHPPMIPDDVMCDGDFALLFQQRPHIGSGQFDFAGEQGV